MVCSLLQIYTKLRQLPRLFSELLSVICQPSLDELRPPLLAEGVSASLRTCLLDTPPSQGLEICSVVLESIRKYILPDLVKEEQEEENMETDGDDEEEKGVDEARRDASLKLFSLSQLLHAVLFSLKTIDNASPVPLVRQSQALMKEMLQVIKELLRVVSAEKMAAKTNVNSAPKTQKGKELEKASDSDMGDLWEQKTQEAALLLRYTWAEVDTLFNIHCSKYTSLDSAVSETKDQALTAALSNTNTESLVCADISRSPMSCLLLKLLTLQRMKKVLLDSSSPHEPSTAALLSRAAQFIVDKLKLEEGPDGGQVWDGQIGSVNTCSCLVAHCHLVTSNLPLIVPYLSEEDVGCVGNFLISSLLSRETEGGKQCPPGCLTVSLISSQLLQSPVLAELPPLFSATVSSLTRRMHGVLAAARTHKACASLSKFPEEESDASQALSKLVNKEMLVEDILASSKTGDVFASLTDTQTEELVDLIQILTQLNPDGMSSEDLSSTFLLLFFMLTSTSTQADAVFLVKVLKVLTYLVESSNFNSVLKLVHGGTLLQACVSSLLWRSSSGRFQSTCSSEWLDLIKALQGFISSSVELIIMRNSSVRLNLDQFVSFLTSQETASRQTVASSQTLVSTLPVHLMLASLSSFAHAMTSNLGKSKPLDQILTQMLARTTATLGPAVESVLRPQAASVLSQAFVVEVVSVMLQCELSSMSVEETHVLTLHHRTLYQGFCHQILREVSSAPRPMDFLVSSLHFLATFYKAVEGTRGEEDKGGQQLNELYMQILQSVHKLLTGT